MSLTNINRIFVVLVILSVSYGQEYTVDPFTDVSTDPTEQTNGPESTIDPFTDVSTDPTEETTNSDPINSSTTSGPPEEQFECKSEGNHPDPKVCEKFHICVEDGNGGFIDYEFDCPAGLVFCPRISRCEWPDLCPCEGKPSK